MDDSKDKVVDPGNATRMAARVRAAGGRAQAVILPGLSHALILGAMARPLRFLAPVNRKVMAFIADEGGPAE